MNSYQVITFHPVVSAFIN